MLISNQSGVPQAVTMAPGESGFGCNACHNQPGNYETDIILDVMTLDSQVVTSYIPNGDYITRISVRGTNGAKSYGFQMVSLSETGNVDMGKWSSLGSRVKQVTLLNRKYLEQSNSKDDGLFYANWKAPASDLGNVKFYFSGLSINKNGNTNGDTNKSDSFTLYSPATSNTDVLANETIQIFPNPTDGAINISKTEALSVQVFDTNGKLVIQYGINQTDYSVSELNPGLYFIALKDKKGDIVHIEKLIKI